jgi:hypothetical protein
MSQTASRPWWADVEHLRPDEDGTLRTGRFDRPTARPRRGAVHEGGRREAAGREARAGASAEPRRRREPEVWLDDAPPQPKPERRTIEIRGQVDRVHGVAPIQSPGPQRVRGRMAHERVGPRPDKVALWAVLLGLLLILVAVVSSPDADAAALLPLAGL